VGCLFVIDDVACLVWTCKIGFCTAK